jgi:four helix bundle protein
VQDFRELKVWQRAHSFVLAIYNHSQSFPSDERFGLTSQLRRAAVSIPANIAEGAVRSSDADFARFLHISIGSASEVDYYLLLARDLGYGPSTAFTSLNTELQEIKRMLNTLISRVRPSANS